MKDRFDVQLGVARPVETAPETTQEAPPETGQPMVVVEYRNRGIPVYLIPPLLIVFAAIGIMSYQNVTTPSVVRPVAKSASGPAQAPPAKRDMVKTLVVATEKADDAGAPVPPRPPIPELPSPTIDLVETSAETPAPSPAPKTLAPITDPAALFEHETAAVLRPVGDAEPKRNGPNAPEPPLTPPATEP